MDKQEALRFPASLAKRGMDIAASLLALPFLLPILLVLYCLLKLEGKEGSFLYGGARIGKEGRAFTCWKIRTMPPDADKILAAHFKENPEAQEEWQKFRKLADDPRVKGRVARFIRKASLDELPQFFNILRGDMSLVGPRPILPEEKISYGEALKNYISVRPGLTGLWQVSGRNTTTFQQRIHLDAHYVRNWSVRQDIAIVLKTPLAILSGKGAN